MCLSSTFYCDVFFFQAEDGIRDADVTGVQTCALPICYVNVLPTGRLLDVERGGRFDFSRPEGVALGGRFFDNLWVDLEKDERSEERRVGKECRSRGSTDR